MIEVIDGESKLSIAVAVLDNYFAEKFYIVITGIL